MNNNNYIKEFKDYKCCVVIPTYNNATLISQVLNDVIKYTNDVIVVNDGSTDDTREVLSKYKIIDVISYKQNKGKGYALRKGFEYAIQKDYKYAITMDSDGQHSAHDLPLFIEKLKSKPGSLIIGSRNMKKKGVPGKSSFGNKFSNFWFKVETGISLPDTQSGFRLYPLEEISKSRLHTNKFEFEIEVLVRFAWRGVNIETVPVDVHYARKEDRISHFRPFVDFTRISILNTILVFLALFVHRPKAVVRKYKKKKIKQIIKEDILGSKESNLKIASAIGFGVFMGILPIWGYQLAVGFVLAHLLKLNKGIFFIAANISIPPMIPLILYLSFATGGYVIGEEPWTINLSNISFEMVYENLLQYIIGSIVFAVIAGAFFFLASYSVFMITRNKKK